MAHEVVLLLLWNASGDGRRRKMVVKALPHVAQRVAMMGGLVAVAAAAKPVAAVMLPMWTALWTTRFLKLCLVGFRLRRGSVLGRWR